MSGRNYRDILKTDGELISEDAVNEILDEIENKIDDVKNILEDISGLDEIDRCKEIIIELSNKLY